jgi:hypothetical protein
MTLTLDIPDDVEAALRLQLGPDLEKSAKQELAASWFREGRLTSRQVAALLEVSLFEAHAFLRSAGASIPMSINDIDEDLAMLSTPRSS